MKSSTKAILASVMLLALHHGVFAADLNDDAKGKTKASSGMSYLSVSARLADIAEANKDPLLMVAAARLEAMASTTDKEQEKVSGGEGATSGAEKPERLPLYVMAEEFADDDEKLLELIREDRVSTSTRTRQLRGGPVAHEDTVFANSTDTYRLVFNSGATAEVAVLGDGDTDLDLRIFDENGNVVCEDLDFTDRTYCNWRPRWRGSFRIEIKNLGAVYNRYTMFAN